MNYMKRVVFTILLILYTGIIIGQELNTSVLDSIINQSKRTNTNALIIYKDNKLVYENYFSKPVQQIEAMSASKSVVSIAIGLLKDKGFIKSIDEPVYTFYPEWKQGNKKNITIRHLLNHTSGIQNVPNSGIEIEVAPDVIQLALCAELDTIPGTFFSYNNKATNLLSGIVQKASGLPLDSFLKKHLFHDMGISRFSWLKDKKGNPLGMSGLQIFPDDLAKIGILILNKGKWKGRQLLSEKWIQEMFEPFEGNISYGMEWWLIYEKQSMVIDDNFLSKVRPNTDATTFQLLQRMKGKYENGMTEIRNKLITLYSKDEIPLVAKALATVSPGVMKIENEGKVVGYAAVGYLGQNLIIIPQKNW